MPIIDSLHMNLFIVLIQSFFISTIRHLRVRRAHSLCACAFKLPWNKDSRRNNRDGENMKTKKQKGLKILFLTFRFTKNIHKQVANDTRQYYNYYIFKTIFKKLETKGKKTGSVKPKPTQVELRSRVEKNCRTQERRSLAQKPFS